MQYIIRAPNTFAVLSCSIMSDSATLWTVARQALLSMGFSRQEYWSELPRPLPGDLPILGIKPRSPTLLADSLPSELPGKPKNTGVGSLSLLQEIFPTQEWNWGFLLQTDSLPAELPGKPENLIKVIGTFSRRCTCDILPITVQGPYSSFKQSPLFYRPQVKDCGLKSSLNLGENLYCWSWLPASSVIPQVLLNFLIEGRLLKQHSQFI